MTIGKKQKDLTPNVEDFNYHNDKKQKDSTRKPKMFVKQVDRFHYSNLHLESNKGDKDGSVISEEFTKITP